jgi:hypothetical protein
MISNIENIEVSLKDAVKKIKVKKIESLSGENSGLLKELASQYTMESERETHLAIAGAMPDVVSGDSASTNLDNQPAETCTTSEKNDDLGDNVELF